MVRLLAFCLMFIAAPVFAHDFSGLARVDPAQSQVVDDGGGIRVTLLLSQTVPYRVFTLDAPRRLVLDFREVDWTGISRSAMHNADGVSDLRFGALRLGWSRMVVDLAAPMAVETAGLRVDETTGAARLDVVMVPTDEQNFVRLAGAPVDPVWDALIRSDATVAPDDADDGILTVVIDPGHGGIDPGAERDDVVEAKLMLMLAIEVEDALNRTTGIRSVLTREADDFVPLEARMTIARAAGADLLISLHADALEEDEAQGASVYTLNDEGSDRASQRMAERHERGDLLAGLDLSGQDDRIATVLMDLARLESGPSAERFADAVVDALKATGARVNSRPRRSGRLAVLNAADFPSVLIEAGFLSNDQDRTNLTSASGRSAIVDAIVIAVQNWALDEAARTPLIRQ